LKNICKTISSKLQNKTNINKELTPGPSWKNKNILEIPAKLLPFVPVAIIFN
jgi:hypothetical protein